MIKWPYKLRMRRANVDRVQVINRVLIIRPQVDLDVIVTRPVLTAGDAQIVPFLRALVVAPVGAQDMVCRYIIQVTATWPAGMMM